eukprot:INCI7483.3.p1 GENE.INCI7483.3~~INCI7483.3.p1  ORF type:complete len:410 (-),score=97.98 INCI7483.3:267-1340(-)
MRSALSTVRKNGGSVDVRDDGENDDVLEEDHDEVEEEGNSPASSPAKRRSSMNRRGSPVQHKRARASSSAGSKAADLEKVLSGSPSRRAGAPPSRPAVENVVVLTGDEDDTLVEAVTASQNDDLEEDDSHLRLSFAPDSIPRKLEQRLRFDRYRAKKFRNSLGLSDGCNPNASADDETVVAEFTRKISKESFLQMQVIGQFNLGFIIARLGNDLFIIDQHASDEKRRFEMLQKSTKIHEQPLIRPMPIEVTVAEEITIQQHMETFEANGFRFEVDTNAVPGKQLRLKSFPFSKSTTFGVEDVHELASLLRQIQSVGGAQPSTTSELSPSGKKKPSGFVRLPKIRAMFASRAYVVSIR